ncbi:hypothetical protein G6F57_001129 [Rhizopus arrhizus]|uniref:Uncharacterized protein n=1 Tax=Rhizopus oryzae TaxID=64495 RepID=A0A9P6XK77_RHIOR|nr:hypothetical protein G6F30_001592 [Rhizopus arrhizus]KAG1425815.1 hypothetical protein G6F58_001765 [Rhizopus delemar]KAG0988886.1 hypothetical protein G6F29_001400 [Rhizopus arrhizus]KAG0999088.1 hypothetical protein G6F28_001341 [Rhizopus arrhizus]KAG1012985.1 hypothetical protein G6F27_002308 [Rhizopus arrhizus]
MKVLSQLLGRYSKHKKPLILFRLPDTDIILYRLSDIIPLFDLPLISFKEGHYEYCYRDHEDTYLNTKILSNVALQHSKYVLVELCKLQPNDYQKGLADAILQAFPEFTRAPKEEHIWESVQLPLENLDDFIEREGERAIKIEPPSPSSMHQHIPETRGAMALDKVLLNSKELRQQSIADYANKRQRIDGFLHLKNVSESAEREKMIPSSASTQLARKIYSYPEEESEQDQQSMNRKRLSIKHKNALNLTIFAPSYHEQLAGVRSAPINSNFGQTVLHHQHQKSSLARVNNQNFGSIQHKISIAPAPATARPAYAYQPSPRRQEFAVPPIVPSQQQPPHSAHPTSRENLNFQQYSSTSSHFNLKPHYTTQRNHEPTANSAANASLPPKTPTTSSFAALQRQQYLQPFEHLFDTIETTRTLKTTLDDQIRRSSSLMQTLQASATTIEGLVRNQVKEVQWEIVSQMEKRIDELLRRIETLEVRVGKNDRQQQLSHLEPNSTTRSLPSPLPSATREERAVAEDLVAMSERRNDELQTPPTIVRSQNDIEPHEYQTMLTTLRDRLDRLERQIES